MLIVVVVYLVLANIVCGVRISSTNNTGFPINNQVNTTITRDLFIDEDETNSSGSFEYIDTSLTDNDKTKTSTSSPFTFLESEFEEEESTNLKHIEDINTTLSNNISKNTNDPIITNNTLKETINKTTEKSSILKNLTVPPKSKVKENNSSTAIFTTTTPESSSDSTFSQITTTTKKTPESSTSVASFLKSIKWYYWLLISLILPVIGIAIGVYCYFRRRQNKTGYAGL